MGGVRECFSQEKSGYAVPLNDTAAFRARLNALHTNEKLRREMSATAQVFADAQFALADVARKHLKLFESKI